MGGEIDLILYGGMHLSPVATICSISSYGGLSQDFDGA